MIIIHQIMVFIPLALFLAAGIHDLLTMRVPNMICLALLLLFFPAAWAAGFSTQQYLTHAAAGLAGLALGFLAFRFSWMGGGDGKLLAVCVLWIGTTHLLEAFIAISFIGGALAFAVVGARRYLPEGFLPGSLGRAVDNRLIPYGAAISAGTLLVFFESPIPHRLVFAA